MHQLVLQVMVAMAQGGIILGLIALLPSVPLLQVLPSLRIISVQQVVRRTMDIISKEALLPPLLVILISPEPVRGALPAILMAFIKQGGKLQPLLEY